MKCPPFLAHVLPTLAWISLTCLTAAASDADDVSFNRDIRPILSENCYYPHGFDEAYREADRPVDHFIGRQLRQRQLEWEPDAAAGQWLRRATLDPTGLPPTTSEIRAFEIVVMTSHDQEGIDFKLTGVGPARVVNEIIA